MSFRTIVIENKCKLSYKNNYLVIRNKEIKMIHLSEINTLIINNTAITITSYLLNELIERKIKVIFCDEKRNPSFELMPYYGSHNTSKKVFQQVGWASKVKQEVWTKIIKEKISNQADLLKELNLEGFGLLYQYIDELELFDKTNREGHSAKVYFNSLFGKDFSREQENDINAMLNYGYAVLLSQFNKEIVNSGYLTQLGFKHKNEFNPYNLSSDLMEPFRPLVDKIVYANKDELFNSKIKLKLIDVLNHTVLIKDTKQYVSNAISMYVKSIFNSVENENADMIDFYKYEL